jgi:hypothetical protein
MRDRPTGQLSTCANGNVTCGSPATLAMLMRQSVGRKKLARSDSTPMRGAMSAVVGMHIKPFSPMRFRTNVRSAAQFERALFISSGVESAPVSKFFRDSTRDLGCVASIQAPCSAQTSRTSTDQTLNQNQSRPSSVAASTIRIVSFELISAATFEMAG